MRRRRVLRKRVDGQAREEVVEVVLAVHVIVCLQHREERSLSKLARSKKGDVAGILFQREDEEGDVRKKNRPRPQLAEQLLTIPKDDGTIWISVEGGRSVIDLSAGK